MNTDEFDRILDETIRLTGVARYRYLALEQPDPAERDKWRRWVVARAAQGGEAAPAVTVDYGERTQGGCGGCPGSAG